MSLVQDPSGGAPANTVDSDSPVTAGKQALLVHDPNAGSSSNLSVGTAGAAVPTKATQIAGTDGTNLVVPSVEDAATTPSGTGKDAMLVHVMSGGGGAGSNASVGVVGATAPTSATLIAGSDGTNLVMSKVRSNGAQRTEPIPYLWNITEGNVPNHDIVHKHLMATLATSSKTIAVAGVWNEQTTGSQRSFVSTSASDAVGGGGIEKVLIEYINTAGAAATEVVTLTGLTAVNTVATDIKWINSIKTIQGVQAIGTISLYAAINAGGVIVAQILPTRLEMSSAVYYVPLGKTYFITSVKVSTSDQGIYSVVSYEDRTSIGGGPSVPHNELENFLKDNAGSTDQPVPIIIEGGQKVEMYLTPDQAGEDFFISFYGWQE